MIRLFCAALFAVVTFGAAHAASASGVSGGIGPGGMSHPLFARAVPRKYSRMAPSRSMSTSGRTFHYTTPSTAPSN